MGDIGDDIVDALSFGFAGELMKAEEPKKAPKAAPPITLQDKNVRDAAKNKARMLASSSRNRSKVVTTPGSTLAPDGGY